MQRPVQCFRLRYAPKRKDSKLGFQGSNCTSTVQISHALHSYFLLVSFPRTNRDARKRKKPSFIQPCQTTDILRLFKMPPPAILAFLEPVPEGTPYPGMTDNLLPGATLCFLAAFSCCAKGERARRTGPFQ